MLRWDRNCDVGAKEIAPCRCDDGLQRSRAAPGLAEALRPADRLPALLCARSRLVGWVYAQHLRAGHYAPRSQPDEHLRAVAANDYCATLLDAYDYVLFTDVDELVVADPDKAPTLKHWIAWNRRLPAVVSPFGVDILHDHENESEIDWNKPISKQRKLIRPFSALCKPTLVKERPTWGAGFHFTRSRAKLISQSYFYFIWRSATIECSKIGRSAAMP